MQAKEIGEEGEEDEEDEEEANEGEDESSAPLVKKNQVKKKKKPENIVDMLRELAGLVVLRDDARWFDLVLLSFFDARFSSFLVYIFI